MHNIYDVIIVGAGPAGSSLAFELASAGVKTLIIEKACLPRYKCCGGGISFKTYKLLQEMNLTTVNNTIENTIYEASISFGNEQYTLSGSKDVLMYTVNRASFDHAIVLQAEQAGAQLLQSSEVLSIRLYDDGIEVYTKDNMYRGQFLVGADGASGMVARYLGIKANNRIIAIESEVNASPGDIERWRSRITLELGRIPAGYAWVFPKNGHLSIGIGCMERYAKHLKKHYKEFVNSLNLTSFSIEKWQGGIIPISYKQPIVVKDRVLLSGDAAGLADPLTGEGIYHALLSAHLAVGTLEYALHNNTPDISEYTNAVAKQIIPELKIAATFLNILRLVPYRLFGMLRNDERVRTGCRYLLRGDIKYTDIMNRLKDLGGMYNFVFRR